MLPTLEDIAPQLARATLFSSLDASSGFWQIPLDKDSARKTTFITHLGDSASVDYHLGLRPLLKFSNGK